MEAQEVPPLGTTRRVFGIHVTSSVQKARRDPLILTVGGALFTGLFSKGSVVTALPAFEDSPAARNAARVSILLVTSVDPRQGTADRLAVKHTGERRSKTSPGREHRVR
jgi:hypothetical protein